jgi:hypothetical protein
MSVATLATSYKKKLSEANLIAAALDKLNAVVIVTQSVNEDGAVRLTAMVSGGVESGGS